MVLIWSLPLIYGWSVIGSCRWEIKKTQSVMYSLIFKIIFV